MTVGRPTQLILECDDAERLARCWQEVFDLPEPEGGSDWPTLHWEPVGRFSFLHDASLAAERQVLAR